MTHRLFVYGTLKRGRSNHAYMGKHGAQFVNDAVITGTLFQGPNGMLPYMVQGDGEVYGEVYEISDDALLFFDQFEGHPKWYKRIKTTTRDGEEVWVYSHPFREDFVPVMGGKW